MRLEKLKDKKIILSLVGLLLLTGIVVLCKPFDSHKEKLEFNDLRESISEYTNEYSKIAVIIDGEKSSTIPSKNDGYVFESVSCDNGAIGEWDNDEWGLFVNNLTKAKTTCTLFFKKMTFADYITILASTSEELVYDGTVDNNLRYIGANPNNYVLFNNELWRIIGVMNNITDNEGNVGSHIKIIRNESIGSYPKDEDVNNDWATCTLNPELNKTYYDNLTTEAKNKISNVVWNLGNNIDTTVSYTASSIYTAERGTKVANGYAVTWSGYVGLIYASDYRYAIGGNERNTCLSTDLFYFGDNNETGLDCDTNNWLSNPQWTITIEDDTWAHYILGGNGGIGLNDPYSYSNTYPSLYLNSNIGIVSGNGTKENPYVLS